MQDEMSRDATQRMGKCVALLKDHYRKMRTGRANTGLLDGIKVDYYGSEVPINQVASVNVGIGKARTAAIYRRPSRVFEEQIRDGRVAALALADATPLQGGVPVIIDGRVVGAVGVSGDSPQVDEEIAIAGAAAISRGK